MKADAGMTQVEATASLFSPLTFKRGPAAKNRFMLAPMTNQQSHDDGTLADDELHWLRVRAEGGFGQIVTCASHVAEAGKGFPKELGVFSDAHLPGLARLAAALRGEGALAAVQLYHGGMRAISKHKLAPSDDAATGAVGMTQAEVETAIAQFVSAAARAEQAGFSGVELHGAHGYLIAQFLSPTFNRRTDEFGGSPAKRSRFLMDIVRGVRARCGPDFQMGVRLSPERFGQDLGEILDLAQQLIDGGQVDYLSMSLWDVSKAPEDPKYHGRSLMAYCMDLHRRDVRIGVAGKLIQPADALACMAQGADFVVLGKVAVLHADYPNRMEGDPAFKPCWLPVTTDYLRRQGLGESFITYLSTWTNFVADLPPPEGAIRFDIGEYLRKGAARKH